MSRLGKRPIVIPAGVKVIQSGTTITVKGPKGELSRDFALSPRVRFQLSDKELTLTRVDDSREARAEHGLVRALVQNMVQGVVQPFARELDIVGVGYRAEIKGKVLNLSLGFSHPVEFPIPTGVAIAVDKQTHLTVSGSNRESVGETAARLRRLRPPEPYKGKGIKYTQEILVRKVGKAAAGAGAGAKGGG